MNQTKKKTFANSLNKNFWKKEAQILTQWFTKNHRPLPWRLSRKPYPIWISEIMLQQTRVQVVIAFFEKFMERFPEVQDLAQAPLEEVYKHWAGLGYYSRARNIHKAANELSQRSGFPKTYKELLKLPGFGDYTARALSSQAFGEPVGVVDGNVIRLLSRRFGLEVEHWRHPGKKDLQKRADLYALGASDPGVLNQALMELGATICLPQNPKCFLCPLKKNCTALCNDKIKDLPLKKPKRKTEIWQWKAELHEEKGKLAFVRNEYAPFLKKQWILPGAVIRKSKPPFHFDFQHSITHHKIYVHLSKNPPLCKQKRKELVWMTPKKIKEKAPFSLIQKAMDRGLDNKEA